MKAVVMFYRRTNSLNTAILKKGERYYGMLVNKAISLASMQFSTGRD